MGSIEAGMHPKLPADLEKKHNVSRETKDALELYVSLLLKWQARINLIGPATTDDVWNRHIADSLAIAPLVKDVAGNNAVCIADIGTGAGLPGIPVALLLRDNLELDLHLIDSNIKKAAFLREAVRAVGLSAHIHHSRIENLVASDNDPKPDIVVSRALAPLDKLCEFTASWLQNGAIGLFQKGRHVDKELEETAHRDWLSYKVFKFGSDGDGAIVRVAAEPEVQD